MAAPTNSGESDMATEDFFSNLLSLPTPRLSPPRHFLPSSSSMVMQYQECTQSMDNPPQNQEHDDIVDLPPDLARDSALLPQQLRKNNQGFEESNMGFEESMKMTTCFNFPPSSPTYFPLYPPMPSVFYVSTNIQDISLAWSYPHLVADKSGVFHVINREEGNNIFKLLFYDIYNQILHGFQSRLDNGLRLTDMEPADVNKMIGEYIMEADIDKMFEVKIRQINGLEQHDHEDIVDQPAIELLGLVGEVEQLIQNRGGELGVILGGAVFNDNGREWRKGSPTTSETLHICRAEYSARVQLGHSGQWVIENRFKCNHLNIGKFTTVEDSISTYEMVMRWSGWMDPTCFPRLIENENRISKLPLQLSLTTQELNPVEAVGTGSVGAGDCIMADQARLNSRCLKKRKEKNPRGERRSKKTNGVRIVIPLEDILRTKGMSLKEAANHLGVSRSSLKDACRGYGIPRWPPRKLITQSHPNDISVLVDQEGIPRSNYDTLPSDQALAATVEKNTSVIVKEILPPLFSPTAQQERLDEDFGNVEAKAVGIGIGGTGQSEMEEGQLNFKYLGKEKRKETTPRGERRNKEIGGVRIAISLEEILQTKEMSLKDAAKRLKVSKSTLKRACREYDIPRWPPRWEHKLISQPCPNESPAVVDKESIPQLNSDTLLSSNQVSATIGTESVTVKARFGTVTIRFQLSSPWRMIELKQQVEKRLESENGTYHICYKDQDNDDDFLIACDDDLLYHISHSSLSGTNSIEVFLKPK